MTPSCRELLGDSIRHSGSGAPGKTITVARSALRGFGTLTGWAAIVCAGRAA
jgi:hypothetical protein